MAESLTLSRKGLTDDWAKFVFLSEELARNIKQPQVEIPTPVKTEEVRPKRPHIINHVLNNANTWYEIALPRNIKAWKLKTRGVHELNYSFEPSHSTYITLERGMVIDSDTSPELTSYSAIYVSSEDSNVTVELEIWRNS